MPATAPEGPITGVDVVLIVSGGRTATSLLGRRLQALIPDAFSVHEPDLLNPRRLRAQTWPAIRDFGVRQVLLDRVRGRSGVRVLGEAWRAGERGADETVAAMVAQRGAYWTSRGKPLVIESYGQWYTLLPLLPRIVARYKVIGIVRDPRDWVRSWARYGGRFDQGDHVTRLGFRRLDPVRLGHAASAGRWDQLDSFERTCWAWAYTARCLAEAADADPAVRLFRFEDLLGPQRRAHLDALLDFVTTWPHRRYSYHLDPAVLDERVNASPDRAFPAWPDWTPDRARALDRHCGALMGRFGYGDEPAWRALLDRAAP